jgi:hypothetical protein
LYHHCGPVRRINKMLVGFEVLAAVVMKVAIFWDTGLSSLYVNKILGGH